MIEDLSELVVQPFPMPSQLIRASVSRQQMASESALSEQEALDVQSLPKPWEPGTCTGPVREELWVWLDQVARWINEEHLWAVDRPGLPECWPQHPHLVHELAVVASYRYVTTFAFSPVALEAWHRSVLPAFLDRLTTRLGGGCMTAGHSPSPRHDRNRDFREAAAQREAFFDTDTRPAPDRPQR